MSIMKKIAVFLVAVFASVSLMAQTIEEERTWKMQADTVKSLKHYVGRDNWFIGVQGGANISLSENSRFGKNIDMTKPSSASTSPLPSELASRWHISSRSLAQTARP